MGWMGAGEPILCHFFFFESGPNSLRGQRNIVLLTGGGGPLDMLESS